MTGRTVYVYRDGKVVPNDEPKLEQIGVDSSCFDWRYLQYLQHKVREQLAVPKRLIYGEGQAPSNSSVLSFGHLAGRSYRARPHLEGPTGLDSFSE